MQMFICGYWQILLYRSALLLLLLKMYHNKSGQAALFA